jgi:hypothetical protein
VGEDLDLGRRELFAGNIVLTITSRLRNTAKITVCTAGIAAGIQTYFL